MICIGAALCIKGCGKRASFNIEGEKPLYCADHRDKKTMINVVSKKCKKCSKKPIFNFVGETTGLYCFEHADDDMIDVVNK
jgi:hypothetical protein